MSNIFNALAPIVQDICTTTFGHTLQWEKENGESLYVSCLYNSGAGNSKLGKKTYATDVETVEVKRKEVPGLYEVIKGNGKPTLIVTNSAGSTTYVGIGIDSKSDENTLVITLRKKG